MALRQFRLTEDDRSLARGDRIFLATAYAGAIAYALIILIPLYYVVISSFKSNTEIFNAPLRLPSSWSFSNYLTAQSQVDLIRAIGNSFRIVVGAELLALVVGFLAAYAIARYALPEARWMQLLFGVGFLIPPFALLLPVFLLAANIGLLYDPIYIILFYAATRLPLTILLLASFIRDIPIEVEESAMIDGASRFQIVRSIVLPLTQSGIATAATLNFLSIWNEYLFALVLLNSKTRTVQLAVPALRSERLVDYGLVAAGVVISLVPVYIVFMLFQERIVRGMASGSVKG